MFWDVKAFHVFNRYTDCTVAYDSYKLPILLLLPPASPPDRVVKPVPVAELIGSMARESSYPTRIGWGAGCIYICVWHYCLFCCLRGNRITCWIERRKPDVIM